MNTSVSPGSSLLRGLFAGETSAPQQQKCYTGDVNECLHNLSGSRGCMCKFVRVYVLLVEYDNFLSSSANERKQTSRASSIKNNSTDIDCFVVDLPGLHLTFVTVCLLSVIRKQQLRLCHYYIDQSELLTRFRTDFTGPWARIHQIPFQ